MTSVNSDNVDKILAKGVTVHKADKGRVFFSLESTKAALLTLLEAEAIPVEFDNDIQDFVKAIPLSKVRELFGG